MATERRMSLQTSTNTISGSSNLSTNKQTYGGSPGGGGNATEKECRQVFFDCAL